MKQEMMNSSEYPSDVVLPERMCVQAYKLSQLNSSFPVPHTRYMNGPTAS